ncbi:hypothetical protein R6Q57_011954 [Mikania cordata]
MYAPSNELQQQLAEGNAHWEEQQHINERMQQQINKLMSMLSQGPSSPYYPRHQQDENQDEDEYDESY